MYRSIYLFIFFFFFLSIHPPPTNKVITSLRRKGDTVNETKEKTLDETRKQKLETK